MMTRIVSSWGGACRLGAVADADPLVGGLAGLYFTMQAFIDDCQGESGEETMNYAKMTVPQLRAECKARGLPCYQHKGKRLRKADLAKQLADRKPPKTTENRGNLDALPTHRLWEMCRGVDRLFDPAADRRACMAYLLATGKSLEELTATRRIDRPTAPLADRGGWVDRGRALGVRTI